MKSEGSSFLCYCYCLSIILAAAAAAMDTANAKLSIISDEDALLFLKARISNDPNQILTKNWYASNGSSVCDWIGVSCAARHYRVKSLNISNMGLTGTIVPQLGNLSFLVSMDLSGNNFQGDLPSELAHLTRLKVLKLSRNSLSGEFPSWIGYLNQLESLYLNNNSFTGSIPSSSMSNLTNLKILVCDHNDLSGSIPFRIFNVSSLEMLSLEFNHLYGNLPTTMCRNLQKLRMFSLWSNMLSGPLPADLHQCSRLTYLNLASNNFSGLIPKTFWNMENLENAYFESNELLGTLPKELNNLTNLQYLSLAGNHITGMIPKELGSLKNLEVVDLSENEMIGTIPDGMFNISSLMYLNLNTNHFTGSLPSSSATGFGLPNLQIFGIHENMIGGVVPNFISNCSQLSKLDLASNNFKGTIPHFLGNLRFLQFLSLYGNNLTKDSSSEELDFLTPLANCMHLQSLQLSSNPFNGILPKSLGNLSNSVTYLTISRCGLSGEIPTSIRNLSSLLLLDLSNNQIIGPFPKSISFLQNLQYLNLEFNGISGWLPCDLFGMQRLSYLSLSYNTLFGSIPECIGNTTSLTELYLGSNKFTSSIPKSLWNLKSLESLIISNNSLSGSLPNLVGNMRNLISLDLSMNHLSGNIPDAIGTSLLSLQDLYLDHNLLDGLIPKSIGNAVSLINLDLSANNLSGSIPVTLEELRSLESFNASYNDLSGPIPNTGPFTNFTWESFISNKGLCGDKRFHVSPCRDDPKKLWTRPHVLMLCFGLIATILAVTIIVVYLIIKKRWFRRGAKLVQVTEAATDRISFYELQRATDGYNERNLLGKGSFGSVYKGTLRDGRVIAIKVFDDIITEASLRSFDVECKMLRNLRHRNLIKVISSCSNLDFKALVLEFMPNGSLEDWLHSGNNLFLSFVERVNIMIDVASALHYLHSGVPTPVVHADLKPSNVLLDEDKVAHVCDFGIAKMLAENSITHTNTLATFGYIAPEYGSEGLVSTKCDVYSFGILLMEVFTRKRPNDEMFNDSLTLPGWISSIHNSDKSVMMIIDDSLRNTLEEQHLMDYVMKIMNVAMKCTNKIPKERSAMEEIIATLNKIKLQL